MTIVAGEPLTHASHVDVVPGTSARPQAESAWTLRRVTSNEPYVHQTERAELRRKQEPTGRPAATWAALIPIRKQAQWWELPQDERWQIFGTRSHYIKFGMQTLPRSTRPRSGCS